jgi:hypothetical protein
MENAKGTILIWASYLLNLFFEDCKDAQDFGTKFHYSWLLILIALVVWEELKYSAFYDRIGKCLTTRYLTLWHNADLKHRKTNSSIFGMFLGEMQKKIADTWRISLEVVKENYGIVNLKSSRNNIWIQSRRDPKKTRLKM